MYISISTQPKDIVKEKLWKKTQTQNNIYWRIPTEIN